MTNVTAALSASLLAVAMLVARTEPPAAGEAATALPFGRTADRPAEGGPPLLHDGVLILPESATSLAAFDATTGAPLWRFADRKMPSPVQRPALVAISNGFLVLATPDARLIAFELRSGRLLWQVEAAAPGQGYRYDTPPLAVNGRVFAAMSGCASSSPRHCQIAAYDIVTGAEIWRRTLRAYADSRPQTCRARLTPDSAPVGAVWVPPIYDRETSRLFVGLATQGAAGAPQPLIIYALDAETGAVAWLRWQAPKRKHPAAVEGACLEPTVAASQ